MDEDHCGPPDRVLPWLDRHLNTVHMQQSGGGREKGEGKREGDGEDGEGRVGEGGVGGKSGEGRREGGGGDGEKGGDGSTSALDNTIDPVQQATSGDREHALIQEEEKEVGVVAVRVYLAYWAAVGSVLAPAIFLALLLMQGTCV